MNYQQLIEQMRAEGLIAGKPEPFLHYGYECLWLLVVLMAILWAAHALWKCYRLWLARMDAQAFKAHLRELLHDDQKPEPDVTNITYVLPPGQRPPSPTAPPPAAPAKSEASYAPPV